MNDRELADKAVALLGYDNDGDEICAATYYTIPETDDKDAAGFVRDPRVAMALINILIDRSYSFLLAQMPDSKAVMTITSPWLGEERRKEWDAQVVDEITERAIVEACVEALS